MEYQQEITKVTIGHGKKAFTIGGQNVLPFMSDKKTPAGLLVSEKGLGLPEITEKELKSHFDGPVEQAVFFSEKYGPDFLEVQLLTEESVLQFLPEILEKVDVPLILSGNGDDPKTDNALLKKGGEIAEGKNLLLRSVTPENYKSVAAAALAGLAMAVTG